MINYKQNLRKWIALAVAIALYFLIHEGAHLLYAMSIGAFKQINFLGLGIQIEPYKDRMSELQFGLFNLLGPVSTVVVGYILLLLTPKLVSLQSAYARAICFYTTIAFLVIDPLYLCFISFLVGGGDMNGIVLILPGMTVRVAAQAMALCNIVIIARILIPKYRAA